MSKQKIFAVLALTLGSGFACAQADPPLTPQNCLKYADAYLSITAMRESGASPDAALNTLKDNSTLAFPDATLKTMINKAYFDPKFPTGVIATKPYFRTLNAYCLNGWQPPSEFKPLK